MHLKTDVRSVSNSELNSGQRRYSFLTYLIVFAIIHTGSHISLLSRHDLSVSEFYLPTALSIALIHWFGPRVILPIVYINAVGTSYLWGNPIERWPLWFLFAIPETLFAFLSWYLFRIVYRGKYWLPNIYNLILFLLLGVAIPSVVAAFLLQPMLLLTGSQDPGNFWSYVASNILSEFSTTFCLTLPALYYLTPYLKQKGLLYEANPEIAMVKMPVRNEKIELAIIFTAMLALVFLIEFARFWYVYGFFSLYIAIRLGFGPSIISNLYILLITYVLPKLLTGFGKNDVGDFTDVNSIFLGANSLFVFAAITGRVISDVRIAETKLMNQNAELAITNHELDRFVYSVSHDLSAPLKSILGLIHVNRITPDTSDYQNSLNRIETCVLMLEDFISEILDYSRNKRQQLSIENLALKELCDDVLDNLHHMPNFTSISFDVQLEEPHVRQDRIRLKMILHNLLSNAITFQKKLADHKPYIKILSRRVSDDILIQVEDNGEGIKPEQQDLIFNMFYRGSIQSTGSGLGLYIAKEAAIKIKASISVKSEYGKGSIFTLSLKNLG